MAFRNRALIATQPGAWTVLVSTLEDVMELVPVHSRNDALQALKDDPSIDVIISTIAFDDSQMIEFLQAVKQDQDLSRIPFLCSRVPQSALPDRLWGKCATCASNAAPPIWSTSPVCDPSKRAAQIACAIRIALRAPVAQWIEQSPPKGQVARSIRVRGANFWF